jgi:hypothetical protein
MRRQSFRSIKIGLLLTVVSLVAMPAAEAQLNVKFKVAENSNLDPSNVFVFFTEQTNPPNPITATYGGGALGTRKSYSLAELSGGVSLSHLWGGVVYVSIGAPLTAGRTDDPSPVNPNDSDYFTRWDKFELTYNGNSGDVADLTSINTFAVPIQLATYSNGTLQQKLSYGLSTQEMITKLGGLSGNSPQAIITRPGGSPTNLTDFVRALGPTAFGDFHGPYKPFDDYYNSVLGQSAQIVDQYQSGGTTPTTKTQDYRFTASFTSDGIVLTGGSDTPGGIGQGHTITIPMNAPNKIRNLLDNGLYGNDPTFFVDGVASSFAANDVYAAAVRDILAGFAIGYVGSDVIDPETGVAYKNLESKKWFDPVQQLAFSELQPNNPYYNAYAEVFFRHSDSYGFPFSDRLHKNVQVGLTLNGNVPVDTLEVTILADHIRVGSSAAPEPSAAALLLLGIPALACVRRRARQ